MAEHDYSRMAVLVVDDEPMMRQLIGRLLHDIGFGTIDAVEDGAEAMKRLEVSSSQYSVVLCDLEMPIISGLEFLQMPRSSKTVSNPNVPVVVVTGYGEEKNVWDAVKYGIHGFLIKPISRKAVEGRIEYALSRPTIELEALKRKPVRHAEVPVMDFNA